MGGQQLRLDASGLGGGTTEAIAEKLISPCNGLAALAKQACTFDVMFVPTGSGFEDGEPIALRLPYQMVANALRVTLT